MKHTPGSWSFEPGEDNEDGDNAAGSIVGRREDGVLFHLARVWEDGPAPEADGRLLAAAPDLLAELKNIVTAQPTKWDDPNDFQGWAQSRARAAIQKAVGGTP